MVNRRESKDYCRPCTCTQKDSYTGQRPEDNEEVAYAYLKKTTSSQSKPSNPYYVAQRPGEDEDEDQEDEDFDEDYDDEDEEDEDNDNFEEEDDEEDREEERSSRKNSASKATKPTPKSSPSQKK